MTKLNEIRERLAARDTATGILHAFHDIGFLIAEIDRLSGERDEIDAFNSKLCVDRDSLTAKLKLATDALRKYETQSSSMQNIDMTAREALKEIEGAE